MLPGTECLVITEVLQENIVEQMALLHKYTWQWNLFTNTADSGVNPSILLSDTQNHFHVPLHP